MTKRLRGALEQWAAPRETRRYISAAKQFGLIKQAVHFSGEGKVFNRTELLATLLNFHDSIAHSSVEMEALRSAALSPRVFRLLLEYVNDQLTTYSSAEAHMFLVHELDFRESAADTVLRVFRQTMEFAGISLVAVRPSVAQKLDSGSSGVRTVSQTKSFQIPVGSGHVAVLEVPTPFGEVEFEHVVNYLSAMKIALIDS